MNENNASNLQQTLSQTYNELKEQVIDLLPQLLGVLALLLVGWLIAHGVRLFVKRLVGGFDSILTRVVKVDGTKQAKMRQSYATILSRVMFWAVMLFFIAAAANLFGWQLFSDWMDSLVAYLPRLVTGLLIVLAGIMLSGGAKTLVTKTADSAGMDQGALFGRVAQLVVLFTMTVIGVEQAGLNIHFLTNLLVVLLGVLFAGGALAFGLGARSLVSNVIGAQYSRKHCRVGEYLKIGDTEGMVVELSQTAIVLETASGRSVVPASFFHEKVSNFSTIDSAMTETKSNEPEREKDE